MARYTFGDKQEKVKEKPKKVIPKKRDNKLEVKHGKFIVDFS